MILPNELLLDVMSPLDRLALFKLMLTNRRFRTLVDRYRKALSLPEVCGRTMRRGNWARVLPDSIRYRFQILTPPGMP